MHPSSSSSHHRWSDWIWDDARRKYYRYRVDSKGHPVYDWDQRDSATLAAASAAAAAATTVPAGSSNPGRVQQTPRGSGDLDINTLADGIANLPTGSYGQYVEEEPAYEVSSSSKDKSHKHSKHFKGKEKESGKGKGKERQQDYPDEDDNYEPGPSASAPLRQPYYDLHHSTGQWPGPAQPVVEDAPNYIPTRAYHSPAAQPSRIDPRNLGLSEEEAMDAARRESRDAYRPHASHGESSRGAVDPAYIPMDEPYDDEDEGPSTPRQHQGYLSVDDEPFAEIDPRYRVEPSTRFAPGEIFKVHWSEPQGSSGGTAPSMSGRQEIQNKFGTKFFVGFRRFIVVANDQGHCTCVPILTYGGKACKKSGVKPMKHGIIYQRGHKARLLDREPKLGFASVRVDMTEDGERLSKESRVNYSKLVTVEHNVNVFFIGTIVQADWDIVTDAVNMCWSDKVRHKRKYR